MPRVASSARVLALVLLLRDLVLAQTNEGPDIIPQLFTDKCTDAFGLQDAAFAEATRFWDLRGSYALPEPGRLNLTGANYSTVAGQCFRTLPGRRCARRASRAQLTLPCVRFVCVHGE
jgi:hypothetical protein